MTAAVAETRSVATEEEKPTATFGFVLKVPDKDAVVSTIQYFYRPGLKPTKADIMTAFETWLNEWYGREFPPNPDGRVKNVGDLVGEIIGILPGLKGGTGHGVALEKHGEYFGVDRVAFDPFVPATGEYDSEGTDLVLLTGPGD